MREAALVLTKLKDTSGADNPIYPTTTGTMNPNIKWTALNPDSGASDTKAVRVRFAEAVDIKEITPIKRRQSKR
jgi:hypothetical protein